MNGLLRAWELRGAGAAQALEWLHVHAEVRGAVEGDGAVTVWLAGSLPPLPMAGVRSVELPADAANRSATGREGDGPIHVAADLIVRPPWVERPAGYRGLELVVPRGMAFGSGEHASTRATLLAMHRAWRSPRSCADVGTGSGILALYASVRGCPRIAACDVDPAAVEAAAELVPGAAVVAGGPAQLPWPADLVVANLASRELDACWEPLLAAWTRRGPLVLGGLRAGEVAPFAARLPGEVGTLAVDGFSALTCRP